MNNDGSPKLAATALHNLTTLFPDHGGNAGSFRRRLAELHIVD
jgi:hypothetical protein